ncbi:MAG: CpsD/CapB family tyrosine-protein kinase [Acidobacteria bacterium]|nr:CpsD/CapB family tyrosine-protein kinase [Acidobacteriota bacterium]
MSRIYEALQKAEQRVNADLSDAAFSTVSETPEMEIGIPENVLQNVPAFHDEPASDPVEFMGEPPEDVSQLASPETTPEPADVPCRLVGWRLNPESMVAVRKDRMSRMANEQFRTLRSRLYQLRSLAPLKSIVVTSAAPAEGKSFVAANLAHMLARQSGRRCLLIDGDLRRSSLGHYLGAQQSPGIAELARGQATGEQVIQHGDVPGLYFAAAGENVSDPAELVASPTLRRWVTQVSRMFDWVIIDSPPAVTVSDASRLAEFADGVLVVVRAGSTTAESATKLRDELKQTRVLGAVFNNYIAPYYYHYYYYNDGGASAEGKLLDHGDEHSDYAETAIAAQ